MAKENTTAAARRNNGNNGEAANNNNAAKAGAKRNGNNNTIATLYKNEKFGDEGLLSMPLSTEQFDTIMKSAVVGARIALVRGTYRDGTPVKSKRGADTYFLRVLPPIFSDSDVI